MTAVMHEDCGPCLQIVVDQALAEGVSPKIVQAVIDGKISELPPLLADVHRFALGVVEPPLYDEQLRQSLLTQLGEATMVELAIGIATARVFPTLKRALGRAVSCSRVQVKLAS